MKIKFIGSAAVVLFFLGSVCAAYGQTGGNMFSGTVGEAKVELRLLNDGENLTGDYYYRKSGSANRLSLKGKIAEDGSFTLQEFNAAGKQTGEFKGKWKREPNASGASLEGEWRKPGQTGEGTWFYAWEQMIYFKTTKITTREYKEAIKPKKATLSAEYPELSGNANALGFNRLAKAEAMKALAAFRKDINSLRASDVRDMIAGMSNYIEVSYGIEFADEDLISVNFTESAFTGGAHPNSSTFTLTYDLKAGRQLKLADLFKPGTKYLATIAEYAISDLKDRKDPETGENLGIGQELWEEGAAPTAENYANWNITRKGLLITFPPYQVAAYAFGPQTVIVPYSHLMDIAKVGGALKKSAK